MFQSSHVFKEIHNTYIKYLEYYLERKRANELVYIDLISKWTSRQNSAEVSSSEGTVLQNSSARVLPLKGRSLPDTPPSSAFSPCMKTDVQDVYNKWMNSSRAYTTNVTLLQLRKSKLQHHWRASIRNIRICEGNKWF